MAFDENGNWVDDTQQQDLEALWNRASGDLNSYVDRENKGSTINWDAAKNSFMQQAQGGQGNYGDWVNRTMDARNSWLNAPSAPNINPNSGIVGQGGKYDYEALRSAWLAPGFNTRVQGGQGDLAKFIQEHPEFATGVTVRNDAIFDPQGRFIADLIGDVGGKNSRIFLRGSSNNKPAAPKGPIGTVTSDPRNTGPSAGAPGNGTPGAPGTTPAANDPAWDALYNQLLQRSQQSLAIDRNDPTIRAQGDAYAAAAERARRNYISDAAENQGSLANLRGEERLAAERMGQSVAANEASLMQRELDARREEIQNALTQRQGMLTAQQQMALQKELTLIDDATKRLGLANQNSQFYANLKQQGSQFNQDLAFRRAQLAEQSRSEAARLGFSYDSLEWQRSPMNPQNRL